MGKSKNDKDVVIKQSYLDALHAYENVVLTLESGYEGLTITKRTFKLMDKANDLLREANEDIRSARDLIEDEDGPAAKEFKRLTGIIDKRNGEILKLKEKLAGKTLKTPKASARRGNSDA